MEVVKKKLFWNLFRIAVSVTALWIVVQGVTLNDRVLLKSGVEKVGLTTSGQDQAPESAWIQFETTDGVVERIATGDIARDEDGALRISFGLRTAWRTSAKALLLAALAIHSLVIFPQALRFQLMLGAQTIRVRYWESLKLSIAGNFLNFATPLGSNMGDVFKAYFVALHTEHKTEAAATVLLDRLIGLATLVIVVCAITALGPAGSRLSELSPYAIGILGFGAVAVFAYLSPSVRRYVRAPKRLTHLSAFNQLRRADSAVHALVDHKATILAAFLLTLFLQWLALGAYFTVAVALGLDAGFGNIVEYYAYFYCGAMVQSLPGPPQGLGTVELTYRYLFSDFGSASQIICVAFAIRLVVLVCALPGMLVTLTGSYKPRTLDATDEPDDPLVNTA